MAAYHGYLNIWDRDAQRPEAVRNDVLNTDDIRYHVVADGVDYALRILGSVRGGQALFIAGMSVMKSISTQQSFYPQEARDELVKCYTTFQTQLRRRFVNVYLSDKNFAEKDAKYVMESSLHGNFAKRNPLADWRPELAGVLWLNRMFVAAISHARLKGHQEASEKFRFQLGFVIACQLAGCFAGMLSDYRGGPSDPIAVFEQTLLKGRVFRAYYNNDDTLKHNQPGDFYLEDCKSGSLGLLDISIIRLALEEREGQKYDFPELATIEEAGENKGAKGKEVLKSMQAVRYEAICARYAPPDGPPPPNPPPSRPHGPEAPPAPRRRRTQDSYGRPSSDPEPRPKPNRQETRDRMRPGEVDPRSPKDDKGRRQPVPPPAPMPPPPEFIPSDQESDDGRGRERTRGKYYPPSSSKYAGVRDQHGNYSRPPKPRDEGGRRSRSQAPESREKSAAPRRSTSLLGSRGEGASPGGGA
ncbi:hypothetical protein VTK26DRAFT_3917 [Humicola hyalothermophila]